MHRKLPVKNLDGSLFELQSSTSAVSDDQVNHDDTASLDSSDSSGGRRASSQQQQQGMKKRKRDPGSVNPSSVTFDQFSANSLAAIGEKVMRKPDSERLELLTEPLELLSSAACVSTLTHSSTKQLLVLTLLVIFKDILPNYQLVVGGESRKNKKGGGGGGGGGKERFSKTVVQSRQQEANLLNYYETFINGLGQCLRARDEAVRAVSVRAVGELLVARPDFKFRDKLIEWLVRAACPSRRLAEQRAATEHIRMLFERDLEQNATARLVHALGQRLRRTQCTGLVPGVIGALEHIKFPDIDQAIINALQMRAGTPGSGAAAAASQRASGHLSRGEARRRKDEARINHEFHDARSARAKLAAQQRGTQLLRAVFLIYVRILKSAATAGTEMEPLLLAALDGLGLRAHLVSVDLVTDVMRALAELSQQGMAAASGGNSSVSLAVAVKCARSAFSIVQRQQHVVSIDLTPFTKCLYESLLALVAPPPPASAVASASSSDELTRDKLYSDMLDDCIAGIKSALLESSRSAADLNSTAAFVQRVCLAALAAPPPVCLRLHSLARTLLVRYPALQSLLEDNAAIDIFDECLTQPEQSNARSSSLWSLSLMSSHFHPDCQKSTITSFSFE